MDYRWDGFDSIYRSTDSDRFYDSRVQSQRTPRLCVSLLPIAALYPFRQVLCTGDSVATLTAPPGFTYLWSTGATTQSITIHNPQSGQTFSCTLTAANLLQCYHLSNIILHGYLYKFHAWDRLCGTKHAIQRFIIRESKQCHKLEMEFRRCYCSSKWSSKPHTYIY